jgi:hypothetical protein
LTLIPLQKSISIQALLTLYAALTISFGACNDSLRVLQLLSLDLVDELLEHVERALEARNDTAATAAAVALADVSDDHVQSGHTSVHVEGLHFQRVERHADLAYIHSSNNFGQLTSLWMNTER